MNNSKTTITSAKELSGISRLALDEALAAAGETKALVVGRGCLGKVAEVFRAQFPGAGAVIVADKNTMRVAGEAIRAALAAGGIAQREPFVFTDPNLYAEYKYVEQLAASLRTHDAIPVAVGSGTINDLAKRAAHERGRQYFCAGTAASMDGYTAFGASITHRNAKQTFECPAPRAVLADIDIIRAAPPEMTAAGYADLMAKVTAGADWIVADALGVEAIDMKAWTIVQGGLRDALARPAEARAGEAGAIHALTEGLMLGGFAMQWTRNSRPASGAEHQFSHLWDMEHHTHNGAAPSHGFKVGVATLAVTALYEQLLRKDASEIDIDAACSRWPDRPAAEAQTLALLGGTGFEETAVRETLAKHIDAGALRDQLARLKDQWPALREKLRRQLLPLAEARRRLGAVGAPVEPEQIGITRRRLRESFARAYHIRRRFTVLDLAVRAGWLEPALDAIFSHSPAP